MSTPRRSGFEAVSDKRTAVRRAEEAGVVADSMDVRLALVRRFDAKEITLEQMQAELAKIKRETKRNGKLTRSQVYNRG